MVSRANRDSVYNRAMDLIYSAQEAKAKFSEVMRHVRAGGTVTVTYHGKPVAEVRPIEKEPTATDRRIEELTRRGIIGPARFDDAEIGPSQHSPGALARFLADRNR